MDNTAAKLATAAVAGCCSIGLGLAFAYIRQSKISASCDDISSSASDDADNNDSFCSTEGRKSELCRKNNKCRRIRSSSVDALDEDRFGNRVVSRSVKDHYWSVPFCDKDLNVSSAGEDFHADSFTDKTEIISESRLISVDKLNSDSTAACPVTCDSDSAVTTISTVSSIATSVTAPDSDTATLVISNSITAVTPTTSDSSTPVVPISIDCSAVSVADLNSEKDTNKDSPFRIFPGNTAFSKTTKTNDENACKMVTNSDIDDLSDSIFANNNTGQHTATTKTDNEIVDNHNGNIKYNVGENIAESSEVKVVNKAIEPTDHCKAILEAEAGCEDVFESEPKSDELCESESGSEEFIGRNRMTGNQDADFLHMVPEGKIQSSTHNTEHDAVESHGLDGLHQNDYQTLNIDDFYKGRLQMNSFRQNAEDSSEITMFSDAIADQSNAKFEDDVSFHDGTTFREDINGHNDITIIHNPGALESGLKFGTISETAGLKDRVDFVYDIEPLDGSMLFLCAQSYEPLQPVNYLNNYSTYETRILERLSPPAGKDLRGDFQSGAYKDSNDQSCEFQLRHLGRAHSVSRELLTKGILSRGAGSRMKALSRDSLLHDVTGLNSKSQNVLYRDDGTTLPSKLYDLNPENITSQYARRFSLSREPQSSERVSSDHSFFKSRSSVPRDFAFISTPDYLPQNSSDILFSRKLQSDERASHDHSLYKSRSSVPRDLPSNQPLILSRNFRSCETLSGTSSSQNSLNVSAVKINSSRQQLHSRARRLSAVSNNLCSNPCGSNLLANAPSPSTLTQSIPCQSTMPKDAPSQSTLRQTASYQSTFPPSASYQSTLPPSTVYQSTLPPKAPYQSTLPPSAPHQSTLPPSSPYQSSLPPNAPYHSTLPPSAPYPSTLPPSAPCQSTSRIKSLSRDSLLYDSTRLNGKSQNAFGVEDDGKSSSKLNDVDSEYIMPQNIKHFSLLQELPSIEGVSSDRSLSKSRSSVPRDFTFVSTPDYLLQNSRLSDIPLSQSDERASYDHSPYKSRSSVPCDLPSNQALVLSRNFGSCETLSGTSSSQNSQSVSAVKSNSPRQQLHSRARRLSAVSNNLCSNPCGSKLLTNAPSPSTLIQSIPCQSTLPPRAPCQSILSQSIPCQLNLSSRAPCKSTLTQNTPCQPDAFQPHTSTYPISSLFKPDSTQPQSKCSLLLDQTYGTDFHHPDSKDSKARLNNQSLSTVPALTTLSCNQPDFPCTKYPSLAQCNEISSSSALPKTLFTSDSSIPRLTPPLSKRSSIRYRPPRERTHAVSESTTTSDSGKTFLTLPPSVDPPLIARVVESPPITPVASQLQLPAPRTSHRISTQHWLQSREANRNSGARSATPRLTSAFDEPQEISSPSQSLGWKSFNFPSHSSLFPERKNEGKSLIFCHETNFVHDPKFQVSELQSSSTTVPEKPTREHLVYSPSGKSSPGLKTNTELCDWISFSEAKPNDDIFEPWWKKDPVQTYSTCSEIRTNSNPYKPESICQDVPYQKVSSQGKINRNETNGSWLHKFKPSKRSNHSNNCDDTHNVDNPWESVATTKLVDMHRVSAREKISEIFHRRKAKEFKDKLFDDNFVDSDNSTTTNVPFTQPDLLSQDLNMDRNSFDTSLVVKSQSEDKPDLLSEALTKNEAMKIPDYVLERRPLMADDEEDDEEDGKRDYFLTKQSPFLYNDRLHSTEIVSSSISPDIPRLAVSNITDIKSNNCGGAAFDEFGHGDTFRTAGNSSETTKAVDFRRQRSFSSGHQVDYGVIISVVNSNLDRGMDSDGILSSLNLICRLASNPDAVPYILSAKAPRCFLSLLNPVSQSEEVVCTWLKILSDILWTSKENNLTYSCLPKAPAGCSIEGSMYTALFGCSQNSALRQRLLELSAHANTSVAQLSCDVYSCLASS